MGDKFLASVSTSILSVTIGPVSPKTYQLNVHDLKVAKCYATKASVAAKQALLLRLILVFTRHFFHIITVQDGLTKDYLPE